MMKKVSIIDYGAGNIHSVYSALKKISTYKIEVITEQSSLTVSDYIILPGVGAFVKPIEFFAANPEFKEYIFSHIAAGKPFLGICVGMQILADKGYENVVSNGLGLISGEVKKFSKTTNLRIPHIGWNNISIRRDIGNGFAVQKFAQKDFYFVHSYYFSCQNEDNVIADCAYGNLFPAIIAADNIIATQFHPEKSGVNGLNFLKEFLTL